MSPVELEQLSDVDVGDAVAVGQHERLVADVVADPLEPAAGLRLGAGVDERHPPRLGGVLVDRIELSLMSKVTSDMCRK